MSGTLLLISKNSRNTELFQSKIQHLHRFIDAEFKEHFSKILSHNLNKNGLLIEFRNTNDKKFHIDEQKNWLAYEGTVFALDQTKKYDAEELLALYKNKGANFVNKLDGHFVIKIYDVNKDEYIVINDFIKYKTNFFTEDENFQLFTPFLVTAAIIRKPELDLNAFNEFMWRYSILSEKSMLKGVERLSPATIYNIAHGKITQQKYWQWPHQYTNLSFEDCVEKSKESFRESARLIDQSYGKTCLDLTMGQDSRLLVSAFKNQQLPFVTSTYGKDSFFEVKAVKEMAAKHHIENHQIKPTDEYLTRLWYYFIRSILLGSAELPGYTLGRTMFMREEQMKLGNVLVNGADGQFYKNGLWIEMYTLNLYFEPKKVNSNLFIRLRAMSKNYNDSIFADDFIDVKRKSADYYRAIINEEIAGYTDSPVSIQMDKFSLYRWTNFLNAANSTVSMITDSISPLLMRRNLDLALQIPVRWKFHSSKFQREIVYRLDPDLAREKTDMGGINMVPKNMFTYIPFWFKYSYFQSRRLRNKIKTIMGIHVDTELQEAWDYLPVYKQLFSTPELKEYLNYRKMYLAEIIKENEWTSFLSSFDDPESQQLNTFEHLFKLAGIEYFLKVANKFYKA